MVKCGKIRGSIRSPIIGHMVFRGPKWGAILGRGSLVWQYPSVVFGLPNIVFSLSDVVVSPWPEMWFNN